jgi:hypothetical protein
MKIKAFLILIFSISLVFSCQTEDSEEQERQELTEMYNEIVEMVSDTSCTDPTEWSFTAIGSKSCGGPMGFIAYPLTIDVEDFLTLVADYTEAQRQFNLKWGIVSDCMVVLPPDEIICVDGAPQLVY